VGICLNLLIQQPLALWDGMINQLHSMYPEMNAEEFDYNLWTWTAYPMGKPKVVVKQFGARIRSLKQKRKVCWFCACDLSINKHRAYCPNQNGIMGEGD